MGAQGCDIGSGRCRKVGVIVGTEVSDEAFVPGMVFTGKDDGLANHGVGSEASLDFAQFNAKTTDLDLMVSPADKLQCAVRRPNVPDHRYGTWAADSGEKASRRSLGGEFGAIQVTTGHARATNKQFAYRTPKRQLKMFVKNIEPGPRATACRWEVQRR